MHCCPIVHHTEVDEPVIASRMDLDDAVLCAMCDAVTNRIFNQGLKDEVRD